MDTLCAADYMYKLKAGMLMHYDCMRTCSLQYDGPWAVGQGSEVEDLPRKQRLHRAEERVLRISTAQHSTTLPIWHTRWQAGVRSALSTCEAVGNMRISKTAAAPG
jgi:hypothetical protein